MAEVTNENLLEAERYLGNKESGVRQQDDTQLLQEIADFIFLSAESAVNPNLQMKLRDMANLIVTNKDAMAKPSETPELPTVSPQDQLAMQGMGGMPPGMPPGMGGMPPMGGGPMMGGGGPPPGMGQF